MEVIYFVYINAKKQLSAYEIASPSYTEKYVQGISLSDSGYRTFRKDRFIKTFDNFDDAKSYADVISVGFDCTPLFPNEQRRDSSRKYDAPVFDGALEVCFTGFKKGDKERLVESASKANMIVRGDVTVNLHILCYGYNAGPKKMELARMKGSIVLDEQQFITLIETGEIPDSHN
ncbi:BRCT domain-containing protein [Serratia ficaria]|uniref:hypothetical protein n=1 Tax=Serratia ficaria TaxID=61651 RepID=UPI002176F625|nr:hypothetical protein [Serratia ficaria]CAI0698749.1 Uncharacterised protein [Serratia ficaria]CAI2430829.1 Uncharacterised protein [Serratia ficaria]